MDITFYEQLALTVGTPVLLAVAGWVGTEIVSHLHIATDSTLATRVETGVNALAQEALGELSKEASAHPTIDIKNAAVNKALSLTSASMQAAQAKLGISDATIASRVQGALTAMLTPTPAPVAAAAAVPAGATATKT